MSSHDRGRRAFTSSQRVALFLAAAGSCGSCGRPLEPGFHADHVTPWARGGETHTANGQALCPSCNQSKGARPETSDEPQ
jgi:5-methylcytosine-specific restriction endonuclease McrA